MAQANVGPKRPKRGEPRPLEKDVRAAIIKVIQDYGGYVEIFSQRGSQGRGRTDLIGHYKGFFFRIEVKRDAYAAWHELKPLQAYNIAEVNATGGYASVMWCPEQALSMIHALEKRSLEV